MREEAERRARKLAIDREVAERLEFAGMIGRSQAMQDVFDLIRRHGLAAPAARAEQPVTRG